MHWCRVSCHIRFIMINFFCQWQGTFRQTCLLRRQQWYNVTAHSLTLVKWHTRFCFKNKANIAWRSQRCNLKPDRQTIQWLEEKWKTLICITLYRKLSFSPKPDFFFTSNKNQIIFFWTQSISTQLIFKFLPYISRWKLQGRINNCSHLSGQFILFLQNLMTENCFQKKIPPLKS